MFVVIENFCDIKDNNRLYKAGEDYPRPGFDVSDERLAELAGTNNRVGKPLIVDVDAPCEGCTIEVPETPTEARENKAKGKPTDSETRPKRADRSRQKG